MSGPTSSREAEAPSAPLGPEQTYFFYLQNNDWRIPRCSACGTHVFYPRTACLKCGAHEFEWVAPSGMGTVYSTTVMRQPQWVNGARNLCLVDLDEGVRMMSRIDNVDPSVPCIGDRVRAKLHRDGEQNIVVFTLPGESR